MFLYFIIKYFKRNAEDKKQNQPSLTPPTPCQICKNNGQNCLHLHRVAKQAMVHQSWGVFILGLVTVSTRLSCPPAHSQLKHLVAPEVILITVTSL